MSNKDILSEETAPLDGIHLIDIPDIPYMGKEETIKFIQQAPGNAE